MGMSTRPAIARTILVALIVTAIFGLYLPSLGQMGHEMGCLFVPGSEAICAAPLTHLTHWQSAFTAVLVTLLVFCAFALLASSRRDFFGLYERQYERFRLRIQMPIRPTLFQELFSQGILNRKEQYCF